MFLKKNKEKLKLNKKKSVFQKPVDLRNPEVLDVNLVKDEIIIFFDWRKNLIIAFVVLILTIFFIFEISRGLDFWKNVENTKELSLETQTVELKKEVVLLNNKASNALLFKDKSIAFGELLNNHVYWTKFFQWFEENTLSSVKFKDFKGDLSGEYSLQASAPSYAEAAWQAKIMQDSLFVKEVEINSVNRVEKIIQQGIDDNNDPILITNSYVDFIVNFKIEPGIFKNN